MDFRILGPLEVVGPDGIVPLRGEKRRGLVALLLVHVGDHLSLDRIVDSLWDEPIPSGAPRTVQTYVSQLRRLFADHEVQVTCRAGGYGLELDPVMLDSWRAEHALRRAEGIDDPEDRLAVVEEVLALWRGTPLDGFDAEWATRERARLQLLHLQARELHVRVELELGRDRALVTELEQVVAEHPLDERFWAALMTAYARSGRRADALRAYQRVRRILAEEVGLEPGPELAELERRILDEDPTLLGQAEAAPPAGAPTLPGATSDVAAPDEVPTDRLRADRVPAGAGAGRELPTGTVTFLFTDTADSTKLWEDHPEEMGATRESCDAVLREAIEGNGGHVVKSTGDGIMAVFVDAPRAIDAAVEGQRRIAEGEWPLRIAVRMGLHSGTATAVGGDYHAPAVNRAARVAGVAHPGQILVSETTAALAEGVTLRDLGEHELRGLDPMHLHQVLAPGLVREFPASRASSHRGLPSPLTSFVGRADELRAVADLLAEHRLVTLTGVGGCGKTRLAVEAARQADDRFTDGVRFVDLAATTEQAGIDDAVADALGLAASLDRAHPHDRLVSYLARRELLVVLDNCEHLLDGCAALVEAVLDHPAATRILATSREPLGVMGEQVLNVPSLDITSQSTRLFADRARAVRASFVVDDATRVVVEQICRRLDGIPLAIELAAARVSHLSPEQILDRLDDRFRLLTGGHRRVQRQQTLAATLEWSYGLLSADDQEVLRRLAVFPASFTLEAAEAVVDRDDVIERLASLTTKSLVQLIDDRHGARYRLLETVRLYAEAKLADEGEALALRGRHSEWVRDWLQAVPLGQRWMGDDDLLATGLPSVRAAIEWSAAEGEVAAMAAIAAGVDWARTEAYSEGARWCSAAAEEPGLADELRAQALLMLWWLDPLSRRKSQSARRAIELTRATGGPLHALALSAMARDAIVPAIERDDNELRRLAMVSADEGVRMSADCPEPWPMYCRLMAGFVHTSFRQPELAIEHLAAATREPPTAPYLGLHANLRAYEAINALVIGDTGRALALARDAYTPFGLAPYWQHARAIALVALAGEGDQDAAQAALRQYADVSRHIDWVNATESVLVLGGVLAGLRDDWPTCSLLLAAGASAARRTPADGLLYFTFRDRAREHLGPERRRALRTAGRAMPVGEALELALDPTGSGRVGA